MAESGIPAKIVTTGIPFEYFVYYTLSIQDIGTELSVFETNVKILNIALILLTTLVVINFLIDTIALATNSKYDKEGVVKVNAFTKIFGLVRYGLELLAAIFTLIMILVNGAQVGLFLYILLVAVVIQVVIELIRVLKLKSLKKKYVESRKMVFDDDELTKEHTEEMVISAQPIYEESEQPVYAEETPATEEEPEKLEQEDIYEEQGEQTPYEEKDTNIEDAMPYTRQSETVAEPENTTENQQPTYVYNVRTVYNGPTDKFMDTLTDEEKVEFHQVFIEKSKGNLPRIPDYVIGGDNNDFFPQVFIYLGKFRNILTPSLLAKIYKQLNVIK
jgi:membrane protein implicated in regulation of membrane protease activity